MCKYENTTANTSESETKSFHKVYFDEKGVGEEGENRMREDGKDGGLTDRGRGMWMKQAAENPAMTAMTREQHAKPWKSFPVSSKTFMEF